MLGRYSLVVALVVALLATAVLFLADTSPAPAAGTTFTINSTADNLTDSDALCTLREAVKAARENIIRADCNAAAGSSVDPDTIVLTGGQTYTLALPGPEGNDTLDLDLHQTNAGPLVIQSSTTTNAIIDGADIDRVLEIAANANITLNHLTIQNGTTTTGGGIQTSGTLTVNDSTISGNVSANGGAGIQIFGGTIQIARSTITGNTVTGGGAGGISNSSGNLTVDDSSIAGNQATSSTGGIWTVNANAVTTLTDTTVSGNSSAFGALRNGGSASTETLSLTNVTISGNNATQSGAGIAVSDGTTVTTILNTTIANNTTQAGADGINSSGPVSIKNSIIFGGDVNCSGTPLTSLGHNIENENDCALSGTGDLINTNPALGALANNGGPTDTRALLPGSPAVDAGDNAGCPATDQRGEPRPFDGNGDSTATCDIGAYEAQVVTTPTPSPTPSPTPTPSPSPTSTPTSSPTPTTSNSATPTLTPTATPVDQTPTPTPTPTPVGQTPTPTPTATPTPTPSPTGTGQQLTQGDVDCNGNVTSVDSLKELRFVAQLAYTQTEPCPNIGDNVASFWGDVDCNGSVTSVDALKILRFVAGLSVTQTEPCPDIGTPEAN